MTSTRPRDRTSDRHIQEFMRWMGEHSELGCNSTSAQPFIPFPALSDYLSSSPKHDVLRGLLRANYGSESHEGPIPALEIVTTGRLKIFCILLLLDEIDALQHFIPYGNLDDDSLPFKPTSRPDNFPLITRRPRFFEEFCAAQWPFCTPSLVYSGEREFYASEILPIISKEEIKPETGRKARIYKIKLHDQYNSLIEPVHPHYVLKTYEGRFAQKIFKAEVDAFRHIRNKFPYIVHFYGAFKHGNTYNILLEYADLGSLDDYWATEPPTPGKLMIPLWNSLFGLIRALKDLQNGHEIFWHQDVKPANILVMKSRIAPADSQYDCIFKLADFGNSHMTLRSAFSLEGTAQDSQGTKTYGAPECYRPNDFLGQGNLRVSPKVDIWSLACIISEFAVWLYFGQAGLKQYSDDRVRERQNIPGFQGGNCFHNGHTRLESVKIWHDKVREAVGQADTATSLVLVMAEDMLRTEELRGSAHVYCVQAYEIQCRALRAFVFLFPSAEIGANMIPQNPPEEPPPEEPPREALRSVPIAGPSSPTSRGPAGPPSYNIVTRPIPTLHSHHLAGPRHGYSESAPTFPQTRVSIPEYSPPPNPQRTSLPTPLWTSPISSLQYNGFSYAPRGRIFPHPEIPTPNYEQRGPHRDSSISSVSMNPNIYTGEDYSSPIGSPASPSGPQLGFQFPRPSTVLPLAPRRPPIPHHLSEESNHPLSQVPYMGIEEAEKWRTDNKHRRHKDRNPLRDNWILKDLNNRDSILIIDDSISMQNHRLYMTRLFSIISYIIKELDKTGLDLVFASAPEETHNNIHTSPLTTLVESRIFAGITNLTTVMDHILGEYGRKLEKSQNAHSPPVPKLNLYIFTDGMWRTQCDIVPSIEKIVQTMIAVRAPQSQIGIQFISFGSDPAGIARLDLLDTGLFSLKYDIIDHTPCSGNLYKIIVGAIDKDFDYQSEGSVALTASTSE